MGRLFLRSHSTIRRVGNPPVRQAVKFPRVLSPNFYAGSAPAPPAGGMKGQTLRLNLGAWRELKILAIDQGKPAHPLLIEAVNDLFKKYGKKSLA